MAKIFTMIIAFVFLPCAVFGNQGTNLEVEYYLGQNALLPSLITNSELSHNKDLAYSNLWFRGGFPLSGKLSFEGALQLTDQPHAHILTKFSRPDFPLTTGRFQRSVIKFSSDQLNMFVGRDDMLSDGMKPKIFRKPNYADGLSWNYAWNSWDFKHVFQVLPSEKLGEQVYRRSVSYHHLTKSSRNFTLGVGEYFILSGSHIGMDFKRLNPFLPYSLNSHDSFADYFNGFAGDSDNSLIKLFLRWDGKSSKIYLKLYVDEFQIDGVDREKYSDAILLSIASENEIEVFGNSHIINIGLSASNPNFGQHPGPFTTTTIGAYPFLEYTPGMKNLIHFDSIFRKNKPLRFSLGVYSETWVSISQLSPNLRNKRVHLEQLQTHADSRMTFGAVYNPDKWPLKVGFEGWLGSDAIVSSGALLEIQISPMKNFKQ